MTEETKDIDYVAHTLLNTITANISKINKDRIQISIILPKGGITKKDAEQIKMLVDAYIRKK